MNTGVVFIVLLAMECRRIKEQTIRFCPFIASATLLLCNAHGRFKQGVWHYRHGSTSAFPPDPWSRRLLKRLVNNFTEMVTMKPTMPSLMLLISWGLFCSLQLVGKKPSTKFLIITWWVNSNTHDKLQSAGVRVYLAPQGSHSSKI